MGNNIRSAITPYRGRPAAGYHNVVKLLGKLFGRDTLMSFSSQRASVSLVHYDDDADPFRARSNHPVTNKVHGPSLVDAIGAEQRSVLVVDPSTLRVGAEAELRLAPQPAHPLTGIPAHIVILW